VLWATPAPNYVLLLAKFFATLLLALLLVTLVGVAAIATQFLRGHYPIQIRPYLIIDSVILVPGVICLAAVSVLFNVALRDKYLVYAVSVGIGGALFYLYSIGHNHWLYNPLYYHLWQYSDFAGPDRLSILLQRSYWLGIASFCLILAHAVFARKPAIGFIKRVKSKPFAAD